MNKLQTFIEKQIKGNNDEKYVESYLQGRLDGDLLPFLDEGKEFIKKKSIEKEIKEDLAACEKIKAEIENKKFGIPYNNNPAWFSSLYIPPTFRSASAKCVFSYQDDDIKVNLDTHKALKPSKPEPQPAFSRATYIVPISGGYHIHVKIYRQRNFLGKCKLVEGDIFAIYNSLSTQKLFSITDYEKDLEKTYYTINHKIYLNAAEEILFAFGDIHKAEIQIMRE